MNNSEIDRILASESLTTPSVGFASSVMHAVRAVDAPTPAVAFPWRRLGMGAAASFALALLTVGGLALTSSGSGLGLDASMVMARMNVVGIVPLAVAGTTTILALVSGRLLFEFMAE